jgi:hypothetical protein
MYDTERIKWETNNKGYFLVIKNNNEIIACVCVSFVSVMLNDKTYDMCNPQYLCCADDYKNHGITRVLVDEVARLTNNNTGIFLSNTIIAQPISTIRYYTRPLNYKKLRENDFVEIGGMKDDEIHNKLRINLK